ncbi:MAG: T9SS type A sorting domain-containing protein, partial [Bacteroidota bacterium]
GISSFFFSYNNAALANPTLTNVNPKYSGVAGVDNYDPMIATIVSGKVAVTIRWTGNATGGGSQLVTASPDTNGERICTVNLQITDPSQTSLLSWDTVNSAVLTTGSLSVRQTFIGADNGPLPVQLASFTGVFVNGGVRLNWRTISEINNYGFYVQNRRTGEVGNTGWLDVANSFVAGHGTTNEPHDYSFLDNTPPRGNLQYRLKQVDLDGTEHFIEPISVSVLTAVREQAPLEFSLKQNFPNPFNPTTEIMFSVEQSGKAVLDLYNLLGQKVATLFDEEAEAGYYIRVTLNASNLASGMYLFRLQSGNRNALKKLLVLK